ncbi:MAG TPA: hypothetical protein VFX49_02565 [Chloroflexota bacterium]|nr:hypothetical protein [Chloroflexota bacterium]
MAMTRTDVAVLRCMEICADQGWLPDAAQTLRLIRLRDEHRAGLRSEHDVSPRTDRLRRTVEER